MKKSIILLLTAIAVMTGCKTDDTLRYGNVTMGNIDGDVIISDQGNTFDIAESLYEVDLSSYEYGRVILACDVLKKTADNRYDIRLINMTSVLTKQVINASAIAADSEEAVEDPIIVEDIWYSGGYINIIMQFAHKAGSQKKHLINLVYDDAATAEEDGQIKNYTFTLRHNADGDVPVAETLHNYGPGLGYVSFPVSELIQEDKAKLTLKWKAHPWDGCGYNYLDQVDMEKTYDWERIGFEQKVPQTAIISTSSLL